MAILNFKNRKRINIKDGSVFADVLRDFDVNLYRKACAVRINGENCDLRKKVYSDVDAEVLTFDDEFGKKVFWHTSAHILAQAVTRLYPGVLLGMGPATENGFYYDFDLEKSLDQEDLRNIETEIKNIVKQKLFIKKLSLVFSKTRKFMEESGQIYKLEMIDRLKDLGEPLFFFKHDEFVDLCKGPHLMSTTQVKGVKLLNVTGAYWNGNSKNKMLQRIYGISFPKKSQLSEYLEATELARKNDHNKIGRELEYFTNSSVVGQGLPIIMPKGAKVIQILQRFIEDEEEKLGYFLTKTPFLAKSELYKISGHWDHYKESMFFLKSDDNKKEEIFALRPMTCPFQFQVYLSKVRSYRDLPMRFNETSTIFRNEASGEMHGLIRIRQFTLSDGHIICLPSQLRKEFASTIKFVNFVLKVLKLDKYVYYRFSKWDKNDRKKYMGREDEWESSQKTMKEILDQLSIDYVEAEGEAAFYGPKLDIQIRNVHDKEDTLITVQLDFLLAKRFNMVYTSEDSSKKYPYIIHRSSLGCYERTLALLLEKTGGALPIWLSPDQIKILPVSKKSEEFSLKVESLLKVHNIRATIDLRNEKIGYKVRQAQLEKVPYMLIIGEKESRNGTVSLRGREDGDLGVFSVGELIVKIKDKINKFE